MEAPFSLSRSLFMITEPDADRDTLLPQIDAGVRGGVSHILLRQPRLPAAGLYQIATTLRPIRRDDRGTSRLIIHDRIDVALGVDADGAHIPNGGLPVRVARRLLGEGRMLGASVHSIDQASSAVLQGCDYLLFGHVYETESHPGEPGRGVDVLREVCERFPDTPVIAIGGITASRVGAVLAAGARGVAVIRAISGADDPEGATREIRQALDAAEYPHL